MLTLSRIQEGESLVLLLSCTNDIDAGGSKARIACAALKPRLRELAGEREDLVGMLAVEALVALYDPHEEEGELELFPDFVSNTSSMAQSNLVLVSVTQTSEPI